ncbi:hypothetical protein ACFYPX_30965 [Micromonospora zamorensis]
MSFVDEHRGCFGGVQPICRVLRLHGLQITPERLLGGQEAPAVKAAGA